MNSTSGTIKPPAFIRLDRRGVVAASGADAATFLGDMLTSDIAALKPGQAVYAGLLSPQGKVLFDFIVHRDESRFLLDTPRPAIADLVKRLGFYKLRAAVEIADLSDMLSVVVAPGGRPDGLETVADPRLPALGGRALVDAADAAAFGSDEDVYDRLRIGLGVPEALMDYSYGEVFPHDIAMDQLGGIDFEKGCYIGQEVVSRMQHRGTARRRIVCVEASGPLPPPGTDITGGDRAVGTLGSSHGSRGIAIARLDRAASLTGDGIDLSAADVAVALTLPDWADYGWPGDEG